MRCRPSALASASLALAVALATSACGTSTPAMSPACTSTTTGGYARALRAVPGPVRLADGTSISACVHRVRSDAELQNLGATLHPLADRLADRVRATGDVEAARQLGYLSAAVSTGAGDYGIGAELAHRIEASGAGLAGVSKAVARALQEGQAAGRARG